MRELRSLKVLVIDCQATGPDPVRDTLLEIGWTLFCPPVETLHSPTSYLVRNPGQITIPRRVERLTQLKPCDLESGREPKRIWSSLAETATRLSTGEDPPSCPTIIHYSRFEIPFLRALHSENGGDQKFPLEVVCTHEIARRLLSDLPRRGLRAVAGYFGHSVPEARRVIPHIVATVHIWRNFIPILENEFGIHTWKDLTGWLNTTPPPWRSDRSYPMQPSKRLNLPDRPGVYRMLRSNGDLLYVGKTNSLRRRVNSYFQKKSRHPEHILEMLSQARAIDVTVTGSALEAALLETDLIKDESPPYNIALRRGDRQLAFFSRDFLSATRTPGPLFPHGPLPEKEWRTLSSQLLNLLGEDRAGDSAVFGPTTEAPETTVLEEGLRLFNRKHLSWFETGQWMPNLVRLGSHLKAEKLKCDQEEKAEEDVEDKSLEPAEESKHEWTPEGIVSVMEHFSMRLSYLLRRAHWFCLLTESTLQWERAGVDNGSFVILTLENGCLVERSTTSRPDVIPDPKGYKKPLWERQASFDLTTYDRLSVLTRELRRLLSCARSVKIRLSPSRLLTSDRISGILRWV